jgi:hypothetical protein
MCNILKKIWAWIVSIPKDKLLHDYAANLITVYTFAVLIIFCNYWPAFALANAAGIVALLAKELYDYLRPEGHSVEIADIGYGVFGILKADAALLLLGIVLA